MNQRDDVRAFLSAVRRRWFAQAAMRTVARAAIAAAVPGLAALLIERLLRPEGPALVLLGAVAVIAALGAAGFAVWRMQRRPNDTQVARFIEERAALLPGVEPLPAADESPGVESTSPSEAPTAVDDGAEESGAAVDNEEPEN